MPEYARTLLLSGVPDADTVQEMNQRGEGGQIVGRVVRNIVESGFRVTERQESPNGVLNGEKLEGDCGTLTGTAVMLLRAAGFPDRKQDPEHGVGHERIGDCIVADTGARRIGGAEPNLDDGRHYFNEHYYLKHGNQGYDILFGGTDPQNLGLHKLQTYGETRRGNQFLTFEDGSTLYPGRGGRMSAAEPPPRGIRQNSIYAAEKIGESTRRLYRVATKPFRRTNPSTAPTPEQPATSTPPATNPTPATNPSPAQEHAPEIHPVAPPPVVAPTHTDLPAAPQPQIDNTTQHQNRNLPQLTAPAHPSLNASLDNLNRLRTAAANRRQTGTYTPPQAGHPARTPNERPGMHH
ncbi:hypothetical protein [Kitasatospora sp. GAS1066B]|uniref:hypothetical protein n=1 Tax=Kitasatospora sp. GAS1066B TaxID=3156271 RepID=UPI00351394F3